MTTLLRRVRIGIVVALLLASLSLAGTMMTGPGQRFALSLALDAISDERLTIRADALEGSVFGRGRLGRISVSDRSGVWLTLEGVEFAWSPWALFSGVLKVDELIVSRAYILRRPTTDLNSRGEDDGEGLPIGLVLEKLDVTELTLADPVAGVPAVLAAHAEIGAANLAERLSAAVHIRRIDGVSGSIDASATFEPSQRELEIAITASEHANGIIASFLEVPGLPSLRAQMSGKGSLDQWAGHLTVEAAGAEVVEASARISPTVDGRLIEFDLAGRLDQVAPMKFRPLLVNETNVSLRARQTRAGDIVVMPSIAETGSARIKLQGEWQASDGFIHGQAEALIDGVAEEPVTLPIGRESPISVDRAVANLTLAPDRVDRSLSFSLEAYNLSAPQGQSERFTLAARAIQPAPNNENWRVAHSIIVNAAASGIIFSDARLTPLVGSSATFEATGRSTADTLFFDTIEAAAGAGSFKGNARLGDDRVELGGHLSVPDIAVASRLVERAFTGALTAKLQGGWSRSTGLAELSVEALLNDGQLDVEPVDRLLAGQIEIVGDLTLGPDGRIGLENGRVTGERLTSAFNGFISESEHALNASVAFTKLSDIHPELGGDLQLEAQITSVGHEVSAVANLAGENLVWRGEPIAGLRGRLAAQGQGTEVNGTLELLGRRGSLPLNASMSFQVNGAESFSADRIDLALGSSTASGRVTLGSTRPELQFLVDAPDLGELSDLIGSQLEGSAKLEVMPATDARGGPLKIEGELRRLRYGAMTLASAKLAGTASTTSETLPVFEIGLDIETVESGGFAVSQARLEATRANGPVRLRATARVNEFSLDGKATAEFDGPVSLTLQHLSLRGEEAVVSLEAPVTATFTNAGAPSFENAKLAVGNGRIELSSSAEDFESLRVLLTNVPAQLLDLAAPQAGAEGQIDGQLDLDLTSSPPRVRFALDWTDAALARARAAGLPSLRLRANGEFDGRRITLAGRALGPDDLDLPATGTIELAGDGRLNLAGDGQLPASLLNGLLSARATRASGMLRATYKIGGTLKTPNPEAKVSGADIEIIDPETGIHLKDLNATADVSGDRVRVEKLTARAKDGGELVASGEFRLSDELPAQFSVSTRALRFDARSTFAGVLDAAVSIAGPLAASPLVTGRIELDRLDVTIPDRLPVSLASLEIEHVNLSEAERERLGLKPLSSADEISERAALRLDLQVFSDDRIFVRGRGLAAQLGGELRIGGLAHDPRAEGEFRMVRGSMALVGRRLEFQRGRIGFSGSLDPELDFAASSRVESTTITTLVTGRASDPKLQFVSSPELPEDEALARLLFNRSLSRLSPLQVAQIASEVDRLGGLSSGPGVLDQLRQSVGVDVLDLTTDEEGNATVSAGSQLSDNLYVGVEQDTGGNSSQVIIDLGITENLKARAETGSDGRSKLGIGMEWNY